MVAAAFALAGCGAERGGSINVLPQAHGATKGNLLYVGSWDNQDVIVLSYPKGVPVTSFEFSQPWGMCSDTHGDVWVLTFGAAYEYAHGGTTPIASVTYKDLEPKSCAADASTGDLAIFGSDASGSGGPRVVIWPGGSGEPIAYTNGWAYFPLYGAYDGNGNLFFDASQNTSPPALLLEELPYGGSQIQALSLSKTFPTEPGGMQWLGGEEFAVAAGRDLVYRIQVSGSVATVLRTTRLRGTGHSSAMSLAGNTIVEAERHQTIGIWRYPRGGEAIKQISGLGIERGFNGLTISVAPSGR